MLTTDHIRSIEWLVEPFLMCDISQSPPSVVSISEHLRLSVPMPADSTESFTSQFRRTGEYGPSYRTHVIGQRVEYVHSSDLDRTISSIGCTNSMIALSISYSQWSNPELNPGGSAIVPTVPSGNSPRWPFRTIHKRSNRYCRFMSVSVRMQRHAITGPKWVANVGRYNGRSHRPPR